MGAGRLDLGQQKPMPTSGMKKGVHFQQFWWANLGGGITIGNVVLAREVDREGGDDI